MPTNESPELQRWNGRFSSPEYVFGTATIQVKGIVNTPINRDIFGKPYVNTRFGSSLPFQGCISICRSGPTADININGNSLTQVETKYDNIGIQPC